MSSRPKPSSKSTSKKPESDDSSSGSKPGDKKSPAAGKKSKAKSSGMPSQIGGIPTKHIISGAITVVVGIFLVVILNWFNSEKFIDDRLPEIAKALNKSRPVQPVTKQPHDEDIVAGPGNVMTFKHVYADRTVKSFDMPTFTKQMTDFHRKDYRESKMYSELREHNVEVRHVYVDRDDKTILVVKLSSKDL